MLVWAVVLGALSMGLFLIALPAIGPILMEIQALDEQAKPDPRTVLDLFGRLAMAFLPLAIPAIIVSAVRSAAVNRLMLRPTDSRFAYLRLGGDEVRQFVIMLLTALVILGLEAVGTVAIVVLCAVAAAVSPGLAVLVGIVGAVLLVAAIIVVMLRLSMAKSQTFATGRINLLGSWALTRGHVWRMLGAYVLAGIMMIIASMAVQAIAMLAVLIGGGGFAAVGTVQSPDLSSLSAFLTPAMLINLAITVLAEPFLSLILLCPAPEIYRQLTRAAA